MKLPDVFQGLTLFFHQDIDTAYENLEELVHQALYSYSPAERQALKDYLKELTDGRYDETQLREIWLKSKAEVLPFWGDEGSCTECLIYLLKLVEEDVPPASKR